MKEQEKQNKMNAEKKKEEKRKKIGLKQKLQRNEVAKKAKPQKHESMFVGGVRISNKMYLKV